MIYAYIRVSTDDQTVENQREAIIRASYQVDKWLSDEGVSGTVSWRKRKTNKAIRDLGSGDTLVVAELSRLGRSLRQLLDIVEYCRRKQIKLVLLREGITIEDDNPFTKLLVSILGSLAEMERNLISQRTRDALARKKSQGVKLGRPVGSRTDASKRLSSKKAALVQSFLREGMSQSAAARKARIHRQTISNWRREGILA